VHDDGKRLRYGAEFDVVLPPTLATHEITKNHEVISRIWVTVVTKINSTTHKGKPLTNARIIELDELKTVKRGKVQDVESTTRLSTARWSGSDAKIRSSEYRCVEQSLVTSQTHGSDLLVSQITTDSAH
jgi:hypothetical protein